MDRTSIDTITRVIVPLMTFAVGVLVTLITKRVEKRRADLKEHVTAIAKLVNDWYNQVHELGSHVTTRTDKSEINRAIYFYVRNRLVLPELLLHLDFLRNRNAEPELLQAVDEFLDVVTITQKITDTPKGIGRSVGTGRECRDLLTNRSGKGVSSEEVKVVLALLDTKLQAVTRISANILANEGLVLFRYVALHLFHCCELMFFGWVSVTQDHVYLAVS